MSKKSKKRTKKRIDSRAISKKEKMRLLEIIQQARQPRHLFDAIWVVLCHCFFALSIGVLLWMSYDFQFNYRTDVFGWVVAHKYPKQQELFGYAGAFGCIILGILGGWFIWCGLSLLYRRWRCCDVSLSLHRTSMIFSGYLFTIIPFALGQWNLTNLFFIPIGLVLLAAVILCCYSLTEKRIVTNSDKLQRCQSGQPVISPGIGWPRLRPLWQILVVWLIIPLLFYLYLYDGGRMHGSVDLFHEGQNLAPLNTLLRDGIAFRDIYVPQGLFFNVGKPWLSSLLGKPSLASLRFIDTLIGPLAYLAVYFLGLQVFRSWFTAVVLVLISSSTNLLVNDRHILALLSVTLLIYAMRQTYFVPSYPTKSRHELKIKSGIVGAGVLSLLAFFYSTDMGLFTIVSCGTSLVIHGSSRRSLQPLQRWLPLIYYFTGLLLPFIPFALYFVIHSALDDMIRNIYVQFAYQNGAWGLPYPPLLPALKSIGSVREAKEFFAGTFQWYLPIIVYLITAGTLLFRAIYAGFWSKSYNAVLLPILLLGITQFSTALGRSDLPHLAYGITVFWIFILFALESSITISFKFLREHRRFIRKVIPIVLTLLATGVFGYYVHSVYGTLQFHREHAWHVIQGNTLPRTFNVMLDRLGGVQIKESELEHLRRIIDFIQQNTSADQPIFDFSNQGAYYFFADRPSATRYHQVAYAVTPAMQREIVRDLERTHTRLVIYRTGSGFDNIDGIPTVRRQPLIGSYLHKNFTKIVKVNGTVILLR